MLLADRVALVTGGSRGIGGGIALKFAEEGCSVAIADVLATEGNKTAEEIAKKGVKGLFCQCDATDSKQVVNTVKQVISKFGKIDILVNNAGGQPTPMFTGDYTEEQWDKIVDLNLKSTFLFCKEIAPHMRENKYGKVINISSLSARQSRNGAIAYSAAKAGILGMTYCLTSELAPFNVCVNAIMPGAIRTAFYDFMFEGATEQEKDAFFEKLNAVIPLRRVGTAEDVARVALFLASELSDYVTGETILVSGGLPLP